MATRLLAAVTKNSKEILQASLQTLYWNHYKTYMKSIRDEKENGNNREHLTD